MAERIAGFSPAALQVVKEASKIALALGADSLAREEERRLWSKRSKGMQDAVKAFTDKTRPVDKGE